jgi:hypothetical protein
VTDDAGELAELAERPLCIGDHGLGGAIPSKRSTSRWYPLIACNASTTVGGSGQYTGVQVFA